MAAGVYNFSIDQGSDFELPIIWEDPDGSPIDTTGYTGTFSIRRARRPGSEELLSVALSIAQFSITVTISDTDTSTLEAGVFEYDLELTSPTGVKSRLLQGSVEVISL